MGRNAVPGDIALRTDRLLRRVFAPADAAEIYQAITPALTRYMRWEPPVSPAAFAEVWRSWLAGFADGTDLHFVIRKSADETFIGLIGLHNIGEPRPELGIWIRETEQRCGHGREALGAVIEWASAQLAPLGFTYPVAEQNQPSRRLAETFGGVIAGKRPGAKYSAFVYHIPRDAG